MKRSVFVAVITVLASVCISACGRPPLDGPPELRPGRDQCAHCGMLIAEDRCAGALLIGPPDDRDALLFDDIGCLVDYEQGHGAQCGSPCRYVRDYEDRVWISANTAHFLLAPPDRLHTPMGSGIVAFAARAPADARRATVDGRIENYAGVFRARGRAPAELEDTTLSESSEVRDLR